MKTVTDIYKKFTSPQALVEVLQQMLRTLDPAYEREEAAFAEACQKLETAVEPDAVSAVREFLEAKKTRLAAEVVYIGWQGFKLNMDIFREPVNALLLKMDPEELYRERYLNAMPEVRTADSRVDAFYKYMQENYSDKLELTGEIVSYYAYLETVGYHLAHYVGFRLADRFLHYILPGYISDPVVTQRYRDQLKQYLKLDLERID